MRHGSPARGTPLLSLPADQEIGDAANCLSEMGRLRRNPIPADSPELETKRKNRLLVAPQNALRCPCKRRRCYQSGRITQLLTIVENAYDVGDDRAQNLAPFSSSKDHVKDLLKCTNDLPFLKLHGCISRIVDPEEPTHVCAKTGSPSSGRIGALCAKPPML